MPRIVQLSSGVVQLGEDVAGYYGHNGLEHSQHGEHLKKYNDYNLQMLKLIVHFSQLFWFNEFGNLSPDRGVVDYSQNSQHGREKENRLCLGEGSD